MKLLSILRGNSAIIVKWLMMAPRQTDIWLSELDLMKSVRLQIIEHVAGSQAIFHL